jgi:aldehyde:ferredoxin oxidoreductase
MLLNLVNSACGYELTLEQLLIIGERGWNLKRVINNRLGLTSTNDRLPKALMRHYEDDDEGFSPDLIRMLAAYYDHRGWDAKTGIPKMERLQELGLEWTITDLYG